MHQTIFRQKEPRISSFRSLKIVISILIISHMKIVFNYNEHRISYYFWGRKKRKKRFRALRRVHPVERCHERYLRYTNNLLFSAKVYRYCNNCERKWTRNESMIKSARMIRIKKCLFFLNEYFSSYRLCIVIGYIFPF